MCFSCLSIIVVVHWKGQSGQRAHRVPPWQDFTKDCTYLDFASPCTLEIPIAFLFAIFKLLSFFLSFFLTESGKAKHTQLVLCTVGCRWDLEWRRCLSELAGYILYLSVFSLHMKQFICISKRTCNELLTAPDGRNVKHQVQNIHSDCHRTH